MGQTVIQKIFAKASGKDQVQVGEIVFPEAHRILTHDNSAAIARTFEKMGATRVWDANRVFIALDHAVPPPDSEKAKAHSIIRNFVRRHGIKHFYEAGTGICHQVLVEHYHALPGTVIYGSDSHTTTHGALGAAGIPIGRTEAASIWALGKTWLKVPESIKFILNGTPRKGVYAKDVILAIIRKLSATGLDYKTGEFHGNYIAKTSISERMTLCNMTAEMGAKAGIIPGDSVTENFLKDAGESFEPIFPDKDAAYERMFEFDCSEISPQVARPHKVDSVCDVSELLSTKIDVAVLGTCTNGRLDDLAAAAKILSGKYVTEGVRLLVYPASRKVLAAAIDRGYIKTIIEAGGQLNVPACGPCLGAYGGVLAPGEKAISTANRNFKGRMGCKEDTEIYLASPAVVAASAIVGEIVAPGE
ncbi:MAG: aconitase/3-isopropylmalate dehydratase large subunit family protein [Candidatus Heimdallarchaeota archaeon]